MDAAGEVVEEIFFDHVGDEVRDGFGTAVGFCTGFSLAGVDSRDGGLYRVCLGQSVLFERAIYKGRRLSGRILAILCHAGPYHSVTFASWGGTHNLINRSFVVLTSSNLVCLFRKKKAIVLC